MLVMRFVVERQIRGSAVGCMLHVNPARLWWGVTYPTHYSNDRFVLNFCCNGLSRRIAGAKELREWIVA
ncbi:hypothetical protein EVAR_90894_1 [Eumeta japonica]|nr:hypothetical protein EVAR_90894_1 [Eumeta japonica]